MAQEIRTEVAVEAGGVSGPGRSTVLHLRWSPADPVCVHVTLTSRPSHPSLPRGSWVASRELLSLGLRRPAGAGDVRVRPETARGRVWLELQTGGRPTSLAIPGVVLDDFLAATEQVSPSDGDDAHDMLGAAVETFLARLRS